MDTWNSSRCVAAAICLGTGGAFVLMACDGHIADDRFSELSARLNCGDAGDAGADADSGPPPACIPSLANTPVNDTCGIFVSASLGDDSNAGNTKSAPVKTLKQALLLGAQQNLPVYACAEEFVNGSGESLNVSAGSVLFGGLDCTGDWSYAGASKKSVVQGAADVFAAVLRTGSGTTRIEDFVFRAPDATVDGGSSIAVFSEPILNVVLARCDLIAGNGKDGAKGLTPSENIGPSDPNDAAIKGGNGVKAAADLGMPNPGGAGAVNALCPTSIGGDGGAGRGGHSLGIAHTGTAPSLDGLTFSLGTPGLGGTAFMSSGAEGVQANLLAFP